MIGLQARQSKKPGIVLQTYCRHEQISCIYEGEREAATEITSPPLAFPKCEVISGKVHTLYT